MFKHNGGDLSLYQLLLECSLWPHDAFVLKEDVTMDEETRHLRGSLRQRMAPLTTDDDAHHAIHLEGVKINYLIFCMQWASFRH